MGYMLDYMLDHMLIGFVTMALQVYTLIYKNFLLIAFAFTK